MMTQLVKMKANLPECAGKQALLEQINKQMTDLASKLKRSRGVGGSGTAHVNINLKRTAPSSTEESGETRKKLKINESKDS